MNLFFFFSNNSYNHHHGYINYYMSIWIEQIIYRYWINYNSKIYKNNIIFKVFLYYDKIMLKLWYNHYYILNSLIITVKMIIYKNI